MIVFKISKLKFNIVDIGKSKKLSNSIINNSFSPVKITSVNFDTEVFSAEYTEVIPGNFPINTLIYYGSKGEILDADGNYYTESQGYGVFGITNSFGHAVINSAEIEITSLNNNNNLALLGYYQDGISYYATETGSETTDKTLFHIGTGNSDNELDLNMGAVTLTMDAPASNPSLDTDYAISGTYSFVSEIEIHARVSPSGSWVAIDSSGITLVEGVWSGNIQIPSTDFAVGDSVEIRVRDAELNSLEDSAVVEVESAVNFLGKYQLNQPNNLNSISNFVYDEDENCFFVSGRARNDGSGTTNFFGNDLTTVYWVTYVLRLELDGTVDWCVLPDGNNAGVWSTTGLKVTNNSIFFTFNKGGADSSKLRVGRIDKNGSNLALAKSTINISQSHILGTIGSDLIVAEGRRGIWVSGLLVYRVPLNFDDDDTLTASHTWDVGFVTHHLPTYVKMDGDNNIWVTGCPSALIQNAQLKKIPYETNDWNFANMSVEISTDVGQDQPLMYSISSDYSLIAGRANHGNVDNTVIVSASKVEATNSQRKFEQAEVIDGDVYFRGREYFGKLDGDFEVDWEKDVTNNDDINSFGGIVQDISGKIAVSGSSSGNFDGNNEGNTATNGILWILNKDGSDI